MGAGDHGPCWPPPDVTCCPAWDEADPDLRERAGRVAAQILHRLSGARYGLCEVTVRPCGRTCGGAGVPLAGPVMVPMLTPGGAWINCRTGDCGCEDACSCCRVCSVLLDGPAQEIVEVRVDGVEVPPEAYRIDGHRELVRTDGTCWPRCPDLHAPCDVEGAGGFCVTYTRGLPPDDAAMWAYSVYACELLKACTGASGCRLPKRVQSVTREGVTMTFIDTMDFLDHGRVGIPEVDTWLAAVNPHGLRGRSRVLSPDYAPPRRTSWP